MIEIVHGNLLDADVEALVNAVNTEGVMGKGIALQFRRTFPEMFEGYRVDCKAGAVKLGRMHVYELSVPKTSRPRWIINFPTKSQWKSASRLQDIDSGLADLVQRIRELRIASIALPALGCGLGGLDWNIVRPLIERAFSELPGVRALVFAPRDVT